MPVTYFQNFTRDDGSPVTVEYSFRPGSTATYSPYSGACGGDPCDVQIVSVMPNTPEFEALSRRFLDLYPRGLMLSEKERGEAIDAADEYASARKACVLTDAEIERMEEWLIEHHVDEDDYDESGWF